MAKTLSAWNAEGYRIRKGAKMVGRDEAGAPLFAKSDTYTPWPSNNRNGAYDRACQRRFGSGDWDSDPGWSDLGIGDFQD